MYFQEITDESRDDLVITHTTANGSYAVYIVKLNVVSASLKHELSELNNSTVMKKDSHHLGQLPWLIFCLVELKNTMQAPFQPSFILMIDTYGYR